jgi:hypothetical protein
VLIIVILTEFFVRFLKVFFVFVGNSSPSAFQFEPHAVHWTGLWTVATYGFVFAERVIREGVFATVLNVLARKLHLQRQVLQRDISGFQETLFASRATWHCRSAGVADVVATQTQGDGWHHVLLAGSTLQLCQDAFTDVRHRRLHVGRRLVVVHTYKDRRHPPETQQFGHYHHTALLPHSDTMLLLPTYILTTSLHQGTLSSTNTFSNLTRPLGFDPPSD